MNGVRVGAKNPMDEEHHFKHLWNCQSEVRKMFMNHFYHSTSLSAACILTVNISVAANTHVRSSSVNVAKCVKWICSVDSTHTHTLLIRSIDLWRCIRWKSFCSKGSLENLIITCAYTYNIYTICGWAPFLSMEHSSEHNHLINFNSH